MEKAIGGYFSLELQKGEPYHKQALRLNSARNCFEYVLRVRRYRKVFIPYYTCEVILEPLVKLGVEYEFYSITTDLEPVHLPALKSDEAFLYTNYFGLKQSCVVELAKMYGDRLIVDNAQAFFAQALPQGNFFYSPRKFLGVPDGAYLYTDTLLEKELEQDYSFGRMSHLLKRIDCGAEEGYAEFRNNEDSLVDKPICTMSELTERILGSLDYVWIGEKRKENYRYLHAFLNKKNPLHFEIDPDAVPMIYPFYTEERGLREKLIKNQVYVATYWPNVTQWCKSDSTDRRMADHLLPLPIDQRYGIHEMERIVEIIM